MTTLTSPKKERSPVVAIMGHVDHGKSTLLDYIRKTNIVDSESGGITQHLSTYEVAVGSDGKKITFIDTPGHAAFDKMRNRGGAVADIAILIVSAEDGVKKQTKHAIDVIKKNNIPFIVVINKIDKSNADPERVKTSLMEEEVYVEGFGGTTPFCAISAKTGEGIDNLLETLLLVAELEELQGDVDLLAKGIVIESHRDPKQGISATLIIKNGAIQRGQYVVVDDSITSTRMLRDFKGTDINEAVFSSPIVVVGFDKLPTIGSSFETFETKKEAESAICQFNSIKEELQEKRDLVQVPSDVALIPLILKTDVAGTAEAIAGEIEKIEVKDVILKVIKSESGDINESDVRVALCDANTVIIGFHVNEDSKIKGINDYETLTIKKFDIIYELTKYIEELCEERRIRKEVDTEQGKVKILKVFSQQKKKILVGGKVSSGSIRVGNNFKVVRRDEIIATGVFTGLQEGKMDTQLVSADSECGMVVSCSEDLKEGDVLISFVKEII